jgi:hypothetical protein
MTVYARSDVAAVTISAAHGGCGSVHSRPVVAGAPARIWSLTCHDGCEDVLRRDSLWAATPNTIPETPDETAIREDSEKRGQIEQAQTTTAALQDLAKLGDLPQVLSQFMAYVSGQQPQLTNDDSTVLLCKHGHRNVSSASFCTDCGTSLKDPVSSERGKEIAAPSESVEIPEDLESMSTNQLREMAKSIGARTARSKEDQLAAIREVTGK